MLTAAAHGKLKRRIVLHEDEVTSCIFGEMQYLPPDMIWQIFNQLTKDAKLKDVKTVERVFCNFPDKANFEFWPQWKTGVRHVEPDLVVHFSKENSPLLHVLVEVKWDSPLSPPCELIRQWNWSNSRGDDETPWIHLYLVKDTAKGHTEVESSLCDSEEICKKCKRCEGKDKIRLYKGPKFDTSAEWQGRLGCVGWRHLMAAINKIGHKHRSWSNGVSMFFAKQGLVPFIGFGWLSREDLGDVLTDEKIIFQRRPWFDFLNKIVINGDEGEIVFFIPGV